MSFDDEMFALLEGHVAPEIIARMRVTLAEIRAENEANGIDLIDAEWHLINRYGFGPEGMNP